MFFRILKLLEEKLEWLNNQGQFLAEIDQKIDGFTTQLQTLDSKIFAINPYDSEVVAMNKKLEVASSLG